MVERDPFGNEIGDSPASANPEWQEEPATDAPRVRISRVGRPGVGSRLIAWLITAGMVGGIAVAALVPVFHTVKDTADSFKIPAFRIPTVSVPGVTIPTVTAPEPEPAVQPSTPPAGLQPRSMLRSDQLLKALPKLRAQGSRVQTLRIDAQRINANIIGRDGRLKVVSISYDGTTNVVKTQADLSSVPSTALSAVLSRAPARVVARAAAALGRPATKVDYIVLTNFAGTSSWYVYFTDHRYMRGSLDGRHVERIG